jgi:DNA-binding FadR family transcriptional regulator
MAQPQLPSAFLQYLATHKSPVGEGQNVNASTPNGAGVDEAADPDRLPSLNEVSKELGVSVALLREQVEVAKAIGLVEVRPRTGIRRLPYTFLPAVRQSLAYAVAVDPGYFLAYSDLRIHLETVYWHEAAKCLTAEDHEELKRLVTQAWAKLNPPVVQIPHDEHRRLHLKIYSRLDNPFVYGLLEAYWEAYEEVGLNLYTDLDYLQQVWRYHEEMVDAICAGDFDRGYTALVQHKDLLFHRPDTPSPARRSA